MRIIPYEKLILPAAYSPQEIKRRLEEGVGTPRKGWATLKKPEKLFEGNITDNDFLFWRAIRHNNGFMPLISGRIEPGSVTVELKWHPAIRILFPIWALMLFAIGTIVIVNDPASGSNPLSRIPYAITVFIYLLGIFFYNFYAEKAKTFLKSVVE